MLLKLGEIQRRAPMASWEREKRPWGSQQALCRSCSLLPPPWAPAKCSWMAPLCSPHGRGQRGGGGLPSLVFAERLPVTAHQPGPCPSWMESLLRVVAEDSRCWHVCSYPREEG